MQHNGWNPHGETLRLLDQAWEHIGSVSYAVSLRWVFYRMLQNGLYSHKDDYKNKLSPMLSAARKSFYRGWRPDTLADVTREPIIQGSGDPSPREWLSALAEGVVCVLDRWVTQPCYLEVWFEARAMAGQFQFYLPGVTLRPFAGDPSIPFKWETAQYLLAMAKNYQTPISIFYFGDRDDKGESIFEAALKDIRAWCPVEFQFELVGLTRQQAVDMGVPENPDKPGAYQWEALTDQQASSLILPILDFIDQAAWDQVESREREAARWLRGELQELQKKGFPGLDADNHS